MTFTYSWGNENQTMLTAYLDGEVHAWIPADPANTDYAEFLSSGATAAPYVAPPPPPPLTTEQKLNQLLSDYGLSRDELQAALAEDVAGKTKRKR